jgi:peptidyl-prolyl cis-trans isomerase D
MEIPVFREYIRKQLLIQKYLAEKKKNTFSSFKGPTEADIVNYYQLNKSLLVRPDTVRFSIISVPFTDAASKNSARTTANRLAQEIGGNPAKFDEAFVRGQIPNAGYTSGDGGYLPQKAEAQQVVGQDFMNVAFALKQGEISRVIENVSGFQIIKITETYAQKVLTLDDIFQLGTRVTVREYISNGLAQSMEADLIEKASQELVAELRTGNPFQIMEVNLNW